MHWIDWLIFILPLCLILGLAFYSKRYVRGIADFLAAGRVAGRYVICVGDVQAGLAIITLIAMCEREYQCGLALGFWSRMMGPVGIFISLSGYCLYRYRQTKCLSIGQFLEIRYNRPLRIVAASIRTIAEMITNAIGPAVAARFFIYMLGFPLKVNIFGMEISTFGIVMVIVLSIALSVIWVGGRVSLLVTDALQGLMSYPIFVIFTVFVLTEISWAKDVAPVMLDRAPGESFLNPMDISRLRNFNLFALFVGLFGSILNRAAWIGNDTTNSGRNAHEQKMAGILGAWRNGFAWLMLSLIATLVVTVMNADRFSDEARETRIDLVSKIAEETIANEEVRASIIKDIKAIPANKHVIGVDKPFSRKDNPDMPYLNTTLEHLEKEEGGNAVFQKFRTLYYQMMTPMLLRKKLPVGVMGLFVLLMIMLLISTDDSRIFNASSTLVQDVVMPFRKNPFKKGEHLFYLRMMSLAVCVFFLIVSLFFAQIDFIDMFINIMCSLWLGAAGPIMVGGLYTRWGTTTGAFCALIFGSGTSFTGLILQRTWSSDVYPWMESTGHLNIAEGICNFVTKICDPIIVWEMTPTKFPINSYEIYFMAMFFGCIAYGIGSFLTYKKPYNLDRMFHRGKYSDGESKETKTKWGWHTFYSKLIGIDDEYTKGDRIIAWSVFFYAIVFQSVICFFGVLIWNMFSPFTPEQWSTYFFITIIVVGIITGSVSTIWFMWGGIRDLRQLFKDLAARVDNPLDDGWVEGHVSLVDAEKYKAEGHPEDVED